jgi:hypothetical protein
MKKALIITVLFLAALSTAAGFLAYYYTYAEGYRVGTVIKFTRRGYLFKTWEGQIDQGYLGRPDDNDETATSSVATRLWDFSVRDSSDDVRAELDRAIAQNRRVKVYYEEKLWHIFFWGDTTYFVHKVEVTK